MDPIQLFKAVILGLIEGATEFIPVSSTGHLILAEDWLGFTGPSAKTFEVFIQLGAILAVVWLYRAKIFGVLRTAPREEKSRRLILNLLIAFLPAAIVGLALHDWIKDKLFHPVVVAVALVVGGIVILLIERSIPKAQAAAVQTDPAGDIGVPADDVDDIRPRTALGVGIAQVLSLVPGVSRSGATIMGGLVLGLSRLAATEFSFFLAIPVMFAATLYDLYKSRGILSAGDVPVFAVGFIVAFISAFFVIRKFISYVSRHDFTVFAWYRIAFGLFLLLFHWLTGWGG
jgi:undecaprenyl-diphosphatase